MEAKDWDIIGLTPQTEGSKLMLHPDFSAVYHSSSRSTPVQVNSEKLRLSFTKFFLKNQVISVSNRIKKLLVTEKVAVKEMQQAKQIAEEIAKKRERNMQKQKEKEMLMQQRLQDKLVLREKVQYERVKRFQNIKSLEKEIVQERQEVVKKVKAAEKEWKHIADQSKTMCVREKYLNRNRIRYEMGEKKRQRCISQISERKEIKKAYEYEVSLLKNQHDGVLQSLMELQNKQEIVYKHVNGVLQERDNVLKQFHELYTIS